MLLFAELVNGWGGKKTRLSHKMGGNSLNPNETVLKKKIDNPRLSRPVEHPMAGFGV